MQKKDIIKSIIREFHYRPLPEFVPRDGEIPCDLDKIVTLIGPRRSGKTWRLYQVAAEIMRTRPKESIVFLSFEDERLDLEAGELDLIIQAYRELYPEQDLARCTFFFDEIQAVRGWERFVRRVYDSVSRRIYLTGSNARMLGSEIATSLRGRSISFTVLPLSFKEYLRFTKIPYDPYVPEVQARISRALAGYIEGGGFPELVHVEDDRIRTRILQEYYQVMLFRDLVERFQVRNLVALKHFLKRILASATREVSVNRIFNDLKSAGIRIGKNTLYTFLDLAESVFLVRTLPKFSRKLSVREFGERKLFVIDTGLLNAVVYRFTADLGKAIEQVVYWELVRREEEIFFVKNGFECDFVTFAADGRPRHVIQVCADPTDPDTRKREVKGLLAACRLLGHDRGVIVTLDDEDEFLEGGRRISFLPLARFLCEGVK